jgi:hypothetical protein
MRKAEGNSPLGRRRCRRDNNIKGKFQEIEMSYRPDSSGAGYRHVESPCECGSELQDSIKCRGFLEQLTNCQFLKENSVPWC